MLSQILSIFRALSSANYLQSTISFHCCGGLATSARTRGGRHRVAGHLLRFLTII
jgi:hypothetical protein